MQLDDEEGGYIGYDYRCYLVVKLVKEIYTRAGIPCKEEDVMKRELNKFVNENYHRKKKSIKFVNEKGLIFKKLAYFGECVCPMSGKTCECSPENRLTAEAYDFVRDQDSTRTLHIINSDESKVAYISLSDTSNKRLKPAKFENCDWIHLTGPVNSPTRAYLVCKKNCTPIDAFVALITCFKQDNAHLFK
ncbi:hypothetical protein Ciccas_005392 [Cichlidogyrus casuarinus]|uniref:Uncharacterized protein n=1 Tax=Cichlidogyrus casuarinus TaxID=1844966 RepID=A0ABD2Q8T0_9PLAT